MSIMTHPEADLDDMIESLKEMGVTNFSLDYLKSLNELLKHVIEGVEQLAESTEE